MTTFQHPYQPRRITFLELWETCGWRLKTYGIAPRDAVPGGELIDAARTAARARLPVPARTPTRYGVGFMGIHEGRGSNLVFLDWWADENELRHHVFVSYPPASLALTEVTSTGLLGCVWDMTVLAFEREAWVDAALKSDGPPDLERYLARRLEDRA